MQKIIQKSLIRRLEVGEVVLVAIKQHGGGEGVGEGQEVVDELVARGLRNGTGNTDPSQPVGRVT